MHGNYLIYDALYEEARQHGWHGWGGNSRIASGPEQVQRILQKPYVPHNGRVLELGCGEGHLCRLLAARGFDVIGVDVSKVAIDWAREKLSEFPVQYIHADLSQPGVLEGKTFDLIVDGNCLHCILGADRVVFLNNVYRLLSHDGIFFVSSLCARDAESVTTQREGQAYRFVPSVEYLLQELDQAQLAVVEWDVQERDGFHHIHVFAKKEAATKPLA
ncbi:class I SAM-dependent methyltransferase [Rhodoferax sp. U11-2br]|uniref:class I SAM-dependent methyltransferase n=1 Tax=Rhodoferax sp. U11-2br TaxID=2838878 RepID=UPI001BE8A542|nr:class I SAM-dependent methyltransferase [Rhodoferax sp. U11-2br]MBT3067509.1 class I SAM-dependent methyltransferase [Rhodoferax sp. U11-2br]